MRCDEARKLLLNDQEPAEHLLDELFAHVDSCAACEALDGSQSPVEQMLVMSAQAKPALANGDFFAGIKDQLEECETAMSVLDSSDEPDEDLISSSFDHVDDCGPCRVELAEDESVAALKDYSKNRVTPDLSMLSDKVWLKVGSCASAFALLSSNAAASEPSAEQLDTLSSHLESCHDCKALEEAQSPVLADYAASRTVPAELFENFYSQVEERLGVSQSGAMRIGPGSHSSGSSSWRMGGVVLAMAASLLVALTLWQAFVSEQEQAKNGPSKL
ncbi:MAG: hypothetical protein P1V97_28885, partial [Planctomycetota bacterium]|nr:hypothetical protein [Planctomycetota bacterium]